MEEEPWVVQFYTHEAFVSKEATLSAISLIQHEARWVIICVAFYEHSKESQYLKKNLYIKQSSGKDEVLGSDGYAADSPF